MTIHHFYEHNKLRTETESHTHPIHETNVRFVFPRQSDSFRKKKKKLILCKQNWLKWFLFHTPPPSKNRKYRPLIYQRYLVYLVTEHRPIRNRILTNRPQRMPHRRFSLVWRTAQITLERKIERVYAIFFFILSLYIFAMRKLIDTNWLGKPWTE